MALLYQFSDLNVNLSGAAQPIIYCRRIPELENEAISVEYLLAEKLIKISSGMRSMRMEQILLYVLSTLPINPLIKDFDVLFNPTYKIDVLVVLKNTCKKTFDVHHIFPKALLYANKKSKDIVNALANYAFLTKDTNIEISDREPKDYIPEYREKCPGAIETHWVPMDPELWKVENYEEFLSQRRILLAKAANELLDSLYSGNMAITEILPFQTVYSDRDPTEEEELTEMSAWMEEKGLTPGALNHELLNNDGQCIAIIDLAWPNGIQSGLSEPVALLLNETAETQAIVSKSGFRYFTSVADLKTYVENTFLI